MRPKISTRYPKLTAGALALALAACSGAAPEVAPRPVLASSSEAQQAWRALVSRWVEASPSGRRALAEPLVAFIERYGGDDRARLARLYLAWARLEEEDLAQARSLVDEAHVDRPGAAHDFADVIEAAIATRHGQPARALEVLVPLRGKIIDAEERLLFNEEIVRAALEAERYDEAFEYMLDWVEQAPPRERERVQERVEALVRAIPRQALAARFFDNKPDPDDPSDRGEAERWQREIVLEQLALTVLRDRDVELSRRLLEAMPPGLTRNEIREALSRLAAEAHTLPRVAGRAIGVVLELGTSSSRRRSTGVVAGVSRALGLPGPDRPADVRLLTSPANEDTEAAIEQALGDLAGHGAAILVAGMSKETARLVSAFASRVHIPVLLVTRPASFESGSPFVFAVGSSETERQGAVDRAIAPGSRAARVGPGGVPCDIEPETAGLPRFPVGTWRRDGVQVVAIAGDAGCARDVVEEAAGAGLTTGFVLGLEAAGVWRLAVAPGGVRVVGAGALPAGLAPRQPAELLELTARLGRGPTWFEGLGHDAAVLARVAALALSPERIDEPRAVARAHRTAGRALSQAQAELWTTDERGFTAGLLQRTFTSYESRARLREAAKRPAAAPAGPRAPREAP